MGRQLESDMFGKHRTNKTTIREKGSEYFPFLCLSGISLLWDTKKEDVHT
jgi:hypothetical protein